ncbi:hypothetical protein [Romboutsia sp.]|uniref:hypothetical protein n=1 Tax=Romboutsia sp. TaxID=1965302 RepID=UPI003F67272A
MCCLLGGIVLGFLLSPMKNGMNISVGNNSGNQYFDKLEALEKLKNNKKIQ